MEKDDEVQGTGNSYTTEFRQYDPRICRWLSVDPLFKEYPWQSTYVGFDNNPLIFVDPKGLGVYDSKEKLSEQGQKTLENDDFKQDSDGQTYCNKGVQDILHGADDKSLDNLNANQIGYKLRNEANFATKVTPEQAKEYANQGVTVIVSYMVDGYNPDKNSEYSSGHVSVVAPSDNLAPAGSWASKNTDYAKGVPYVFNVGTSSAHGKKGLNYTIGKSKKGSTELYVMNADLVELKNRNKIYGPVNLAPITIEGEGKASYVKPKGLPMETLQIPNTLKLQ